MTAAGRVRQRRRPLLLAGLLLSTIWAMWWLWPPGEPDVDFRFRMHSTAEMVLIDPISNVPTELPVYEEGRFRSVSGAPIKARDVIRYEPAGRGGGPFYTAVFRMAASASRADFTRAVRAIWSVCDADVAVGAHGQQETFLILPEHYDRDCAQILRR